jgi:PKHD-type hydroxylase
MSHAAWQFYADKTQNWAYYNNLFTPEECAQIIRVGEGKGLKDGLIAGYVSPSESGRIAKVSWLYVEDGIDFAFRRVTDAVIGINEQFFQFDLFGMTEGFQFTRYDAPSSFHGPHIDKMLNGPVRKLSLTIQLSSPEDYEGGELDLKFSDETEFMTKEQGKMIVFPSYVVHEVRPVTKGTRYSLVAWVTGKPFK